MNAFVVANISPQHLLVKSKMMREDSHIDVFQAVCQFDPLRASQPCCTTKAISKHKDIEWDEQRASEWEAVLSN